jgi:hypothetical protein
MSEGFLFRRPALAARIADEALGLDPLEGNSGLFLAAPRRTGKSTFLKVDLEPEMRKRGVLTVYVDLWADRAREPGELISDAIKAAVQSLDSGIVKLARRAGMSKVGVGSWLAVDIDKIGKPGGVTLADAIGHLIERNGRPVLLIVDEAQHALTTDAGSRAMFALKSARDTLNIGAKPSDVANVRLGLVFTGSHRDKLGSLVSERAQPFFGASITNFPLLGRDFTDAYTGFINKRLASDRQLDPDEVFTAFQVVACRPEFLQAAIKDYSIGALGEATTPRSLQECATIARDHYWATFDAAWPEMTDLQKAVLRRVVEKGEGFRPFDSEALAAYSAGVNQTITAPDVQSALEALRNKGFIVRLERGRYTLEDPSVGEWLTDRSYSEMSNARRSK